VIHIGSNEGLGSVHTNDVYRDDRDDMDVLRKELQDLGATHVLTYDEMDDKRAITSKVKEWTNDQVHSSFK